MAGMIVLLLAALVFFIAWTATLLPGAKLPFNLLPIALFALFTGWVSSWYVRHGPHIGNIYVLSALVGAAASCAALGWFLRTTLWSTTRTHQPARTVHLDD